MFSKYKNFTFLNAFLLAYLAYRYGTRHRRAPAGAFRVPNNPKKGHYDGVQNLFSNKYDDRFNRFFSGLFNSIDEAVIYRDELRDRGYTDAFMLGLDGGFDRILIELD